MKIYNQTYKGFDAYHLENESLKMIVLPDIGGKIASLLYKPQNFEVFFQPTEETYKLPEYGGDFSHYDTSGADEMFPTIDTCIYPYAGHEGKLPDHGELWSLPWLVTKADDSLQMVREGRVLPYLFSRVIVLDGKTVHLKYKVKNTGDQPLFGLWAFHGLVACDEKTILNIPNCENIVTVHNSNILGKMGTKHSFPLTIGKNDQEYCLDHIAPQYCGKTEKFYVEGAVKQGEAALTLNQGKLVYKLSFPLHTVPYLGIWINEGGFKGEYNCALEPSTGYYDSLEIAKQYNSVSPLAPGQTMEWYLDIELADDLLTKKI
ncbi:MAG: hypothetical protein K0R78_264 [Pelosinus sp.]|jgi:galactose mutarotase-like enzyme|nr:hypothetical protein [Pelosinus sp.]